MKKVLFFTALFIATIFTASAQLRLNAYGAYVFDDGFDVVGDANN